MARTKNKTCIFCNEVVTKNDYVIYHNSYCHRACFFKHVKGTDENHIICDLCNQMIQDNCYTILTDGRVAHFDCFYGGLINGLSKLMGKGGQK